MYPGLQAKIPQQPAFTMAQSGEPVTYAELDRRSNRLAHFLRANGLRRLDHYAIFMENNARYIECCSAGERAGLYYTCVNSYLNPTSWLISSTTASRRHHLGKQERRCTAGDGAVSEDRPLSYRPRSWRWTLPGSG
jgi:long-chain acyl-CoA synthetase